MTKQELVERLRTYAKEHGTLNGEYIASPGSYCAIGFLLSETGSSDEEIWGLEPDRLIQDVLFYKEIETNITDWFTVAELQTLQTANDRIDETKCEFFPLLDAISRGVDISGFESYHVYEAIKKI